MTELKPCPFCGARTAFVKYLGDDAHGVQCGQCFSWGPDAPTKADAVTCWNGCAARSSDPVETLRDVFAMAALSGLLARMQPGAVYTYDELVAQAYAIADAMMKERERADE